ncbi:hypothetical protein [Emticicia sp.]|uniref:hypothetical protein n=1 Tax=Emticicia sp. TaxID=1930953 RepID=UPI003750FF4F
MSNKLNLSAVERYSKAFASKVCDEFFAENSNITGKQILSLSNIQQVNMLTIKALFDKWQADTQRLRSPYFDFNTNEVQQALKSFMNTVSQHISVKREHFEPLLIDSVGETLVLILEPQTFYKELMRDLPNFRFSQENIVPLTKYILINKDVLPKLADKLNGQEFVFANQAMTWLEEMPLTIENKDIYLAQFAEKVAIPEELVPSKISPPDNQASKSFFDFEVANITQQRVETHLPKVEPVVERIVEVTPIGQKQEAIFDRKVESVTAKVSEPIVEKAAPKEPDDVRLNDKLAGEQKTLNDHAQSNKSVLDYHQNSRIEGITGAISLNQRFLFTNNLFGGNIQAFSHALEELELCKDFSEAKELILKKYVPRYMWDITGAEAEEFIDIIKRRFN